jgi:regulator of replication initiation timing
MFGIDKNNSEGYIADYLLDEENTVDAQTYEEKVDIEELIRKLAPDEDEDLIQKRNDFATSEQLVKEQLQGISGNEGTTDGKSAELTQEKKRLEMENKELRQRLSETSFKGEQLVKDIQHLRESYEIKLREAQAKVAAMPQATNDVDKQDIAEVMLEAKKMSRDIVASAEERAQTLVASADMEVSKKMAAAQEIITAAELEANSMTSKAEKEVAHKLEMGQSKLVQLKSATDIYMNNVAELRMNSERALTELLSKCDKVIGDM